MDMNTIFATVVGKASYKELAKEAESLFNTTTLYPSKVGKFKSNLRNNVSDGNIDGYRIEDRALVSKINDIILKEAKLFFTACGYNTDVYTFKVKNTWLNEMGSGTYHGPHTHYGSCISGCFYITLPENANSVVFIGPLSRVDKASIDIKNFTAYNSHTWTTLPEVGDMLFWESYLVHEVPTVMCEGVRRSIAFDVTITDIR